MRLSFSIFLLGLWMTRHRHLCRGQYPKPSISLSSREVPLGGTVFIYCISPDGFQAANRFTLYQVVRSLTFFLKEMQIERNVAIFPIVGATQLNEGNYICRYCSPAGSPYCSKNSDSVSVKVIGTPYPKPSIAVAPNGVVIVGQSVRISCENQECQHAEFFLYKDQPPFLLPSVLKKALQGNITFLILNAQLYQRGIYRCRYCCESASDKLCSVVSDQVHINMTDPNLPKPFINVRPREQITLGLNITIECWAPERDLNFYLYNSSGLVASQATLPGRNITEFNFFMVGLEVSGNYSCRYHYRNKPFVLSESSDHVELLVTSQVQGITEPVGATAILLASTSAGILLLLLLLLLLAFLLCRRRRKGFTSNERTQPVETPMELNTGVVVEPEEITYAELSSCSFKTRQTTEPDTLGGSCVYTSVAQNKNRPRQ